MSQVIHIPAFPEKPIGKEPKIREMYESLEGELSSKDRVEVWKILYPYMRSYDKEEMKSYYDRLEIFQGLEQKWYSAKSSNGYEFYFFPYDFTPANAMFWFLLVRKEGFSCDTRKASIEECHVPLHDHSKLQGEETDMFLGELTITPVTFAEVLAYIMMAAQDVYNVRLEKIKEEQRRKDTDISIVWGNGDDDKE